MNDSIVAAVSLRTCTTTPEKVTTVTIVLAGECVDSREFGGCRENHVVDCVEQDPLIGQSNDKRAEVGDGHSTCEAMLGRRNREERVTDEYSNRHSNTH